MGAVEKWAVAKFYILQQPIFMVQSLTRYRSYGVTAHFRQPAAFCPKTR